MNRLRAEFGFSFWRLDMSFFMPDSNGFLLTNMWCDLFITLGGRVRITPDAKKGFGGEREKLKSLLEFLASEEAKEKITLTPEGFLVEGEVKSEVELDLSFEAYREAVKIFARAVYIKMGEDEDGNE